MRHVLVFTGGESARGDLATAMPDDAYVIAADSGVHTAVAFGRRVDLVIGDLDSVSEESLAEAVVAGAHVERHPVDKNDTDLELALVRASELQPDRVVVIGGHGGRLDHFLANLLLLASDRFRNVSIDALVGDARVHVVRSRQELVGDPGSIVTLLAAHGPAHGVTTSGLRYPLQGETLLPGSTRGVSNVFEEPHASVELTDGVLLAVALDPSETEIMS
jgi:thiamine pyrophosphokinase